MNRHVGERAWLDAIMRFFGHRLIYLNVLVLTLWLASCFFRGEPKQALTAIFIITTSLFFSFSVSYMSAIMWRHRRPTSELGRRRVHLLFSTLGVWKSFPSDHTIAVTVFPAALAAVNAPLFLVAYLVVSGLAVAVGRIYSGVHYPRDIIGGAALGLASVGLTILIF